MTIIGIILGTLVIIGGYFYLRTRPKSPPGGSVFKSDRSDRH